MITPRAQAGRPPLRRLSGVLSGIGATNGGRLSLLAIGLLAVALLVSLFVAGPANAPAAQQAVPQTNGATGGAPVVATLGGCATHRLPVTLADHSTAEVSGTLCVPAQGHPITVLALVHGATYNASYFDWPQDPATHSFVWSALEAGYATFDLDKLGAGASSAPNSALVTFGVQADAIHSAVTALRNGDLGTRFTHVVLVGHSFGSAEATDELAKYHDADALIATGSGHAVAAAITAGTATMFAPAKTLLPNRFGSRDPGWITTTTTAARVTLMYAKAAPADAVQFDMDTRDAVSKTEMSTRPPNLGALTHGITQPVLVVDGQFDDHYCAGVIGQVAGLDDCSSSAALYHSEQANYGPCFAAATVPGSGHDLTTEAGAPIAARAELSWLAATVPAGSGPAHCGMTGPVQEGT